MNVKHLTIAATGVLSLILIGSIQSAAAQSTYEDYTFITLAGPDAAGPGWLDGVGNAARFNNPQSIARDTNGNLYVADAGNNTIRKIAPDGSVTTLAGLNGTAGSTDGLGAAASFNSPFGMAVDSSGAIYVSDSGANIIRKISPSGLVTTFAGLAGVAGTNNGTGTAARFNEPDGLAIDSNNNLYVADTLNDVIRKISPDGVVTTFAGSLGKPGSADKTGTAASFRFPIGVAVGQDGTVYVADSGNYTIREVTPAGAVSTLAGSVGSPGVSDGTNQTARFNGSYNLAVDGNANLYVADTFNHTIRKVTPEGVVTTLAGSPASAGRVNGVGSSARFDFPMGIAVGSNTNLYISDSGNNCIREINAALVVTTLAGVPSEPGSTDATGNAARFNFPADVVFDKNTNVYISDLANNTIRKMTPDGAVTTLAGHAGISGTNDGVGDAARFFNPSGLAVDGNGNIFVADTVNDTIREVTPLGVVSTFAGAPQVSGTNDGTGSFARFFDPFGVTFDMNGNLFVGDTHNNAIRKITPDGTVANFAGTIGTAGTNDGPNLTAAFDFPEGLTFDGSGNLYVVDDASDIIRKISGDGSVLTFAGTALLSGSVDGTDAAARFNHPFGIAADESGNLYVSDTGNNLIRKITPAGVVTTIGGVPGVTGSLDGSGSDALFNSPEGLAVDKQGNLYIADAANHSIRKGYPALPDRPVVDLPAARVGVTRHFSISNETTTSWSWSVIRRPAGSVAQFSATNISNPTFTPDVEDIYVIQFQGWDNSGRTTIRRLTLVADDTPPSLSITNPISGQSVSNGIVTVSGTATDNLGLSNVWVQANGGAWTKAVGNKHWSLDVPLTPGTNVIRAYAEDFAGNVSQTNEVGFTYIVSAPLTVLVHGGGTVTPDLNGVFLEIGQTYSITAQAGAGSSFVSWTGNGDFTTDSNVLTFVMQSNLTFTANFTDTIGPALTIGLPKNGLHVSNAVFTAIGAVSDNGQLAGVWYQLNGGGWMQASNTATNWTAALSLTGSANTLEVYAVDTFNNVSPTNTVSFTYVPSGRMTVITSGNGTLSPNYDGWYLQLGKSFTMTAKPSLNWIFTGWTDGAGNTVATSPALKFTVQSNTTFSAEFIPNPFLFFQGPFAGLFYDTNNPAVSSSGFFSFTLGFSGSFSAKMQFASGQKASFSGDLSPNGTFSNSVTAKGSAPFTVQLALDSSNGGRLTGTVSQDGWTAPLMAVRASYSQLHAAPQANNKYTLIIPGGNDSTVAPAGNGYGTVSVNVAGDVKFSGVLGDNTKAAESTFINEAGQWPLFVAPYKGKGAIFGWMTFVSNDPESDLSGSLTWLRLAQSGKSIYPAGFSLTNLQAVGSLYSFTSGVPLLNLPVGGVAVLQQGNPVQSFTNNFTLGNDNKVTSSDGLNVKITTKSGLFKGTARDPNTGNPVTINGVLLPKQNGAFGTFIQNGQSGGVYLGQ
ncbi:MAG TPA: Ig-like domain-containing protein [Candidatus Angelobacter sp.]|nr:Ig-like domain-containing protein [Candidatus Angelobacter sp.]